MKHRFLLKTMLLLCALVAGSSSMWADVTWTRVTSIQTLLDGGTFIMGYEATANSGVIVPLRSKDCGATTSANGILNSGTTNGSSTSGTIDMSDLSAVTTSDYEVYISESSTAGRINIQRTNSSGNFYGATSKGNSKNTARLYTSGNSDETNLIPEWSSETNNQFKLSVDVEGSYKFFKYNTGSPRFAFYNSEGEKIVFYKKGTATTTKVSTPTISGTTPFYPSTEVSITCSTTGAAIQYSTDDGAHWTNYSDPFTLTATTTVKAKATKSGSTDSDEASKTFTKATPLANIAALTANTEAGTYYVTLNNAVVTFVSGNNAYIQDASGAVQYYKSGHGLTAGQRLTGTATVVFQFYNSNPQIAALSGITPTAGDAPNPTSVTQTAWNYTFSEVLSQYFEITNATITKNDDNKYYVSLNGENVQIYKQGGGLSISDLSKKYTITGFPTFNNSTKEIVIYANPVAEASTVSAIAATPTSRTGFAYTVGEGPSAAQTISVSGSNLTANISLSLGDSDFEMSLSEGSGYTNSLTLTPEAGAVAPTTIYVRLKAGLAINDSYEGTVTLTSTGATTQTVSLAGRVTYQNFTWNLATNSYSEASEDQVTWTGTRATMVADKGSSTTNANNYLGGDANNRTSTRFYENQILTIAPTSGYTITSIEFTATTVGYANALQGSTWKNATAAVNEKVVTVTPKNGALPISATIGGPCGFTAVKVYYGVVTQVPLTPAKTYTTLTSSHNLDFTSVSSVLEAYIATGVSGGSVQMTQVYKVPAGTGLVLKAKTPGSAVGVPVLDGTPDDVSGNKMAGSAIATTAVAENAGYILSDGVFQPALAGTLPAGKAYLNIAAGARTLEMNFDGEITGVANVNGNVNGNDNFYDLQGRHVAQPSKGLYIVNGKKVVIK